MELAWHDAESRAAEAMRQRDEAAKALRLLQVKVAGKKKGEKFKDVGSSPRCARDTRRTDIRAGGAARDAPPLSRTPSTPGSHGEAGEVFDLWSAACR